MFSGENISAKFVVPTVANAVDLVVHLSLDVHGKRLVSEVVAVPGRVEDDVIEVEPIFERRDEGLVWVGGVPPRPERYRRIGVDVHALLNGAAHGSQGGRRPAGVG